MIPKQAFFFWSAPTLSYLRYLCIRSLREQNPDMPITLYYVPCSVHEKTWRGDISQDFEGETPCYLDKLSALNIEISVGPESTTHPVHTSDLFRYSKLYSDGGIYIDTDTFWVQPIDNIYSEIASYSSVISHSDELGFQIGFLAACPMSQFFYDLLNTAHFLWKDDSNYQACGTDALLHMLSDGELNSPVPCDDALNKKWLNILLERYQEMFILDGDIFYNVGGPDADKLFEGDGSLLPQYFVHLYGGSSAFQRYNKIVDENSIKSLNGPIFELIRREINGWKSSRSASVL